MEVLQEGISLMQKILDVGYWWPTINRDVHEYY
jgi:hypothetical protein